MMKISSVRNFFIVLSCFMSMTNVKADDQITASEEVDNVRIHLVNIKNPTIAQPLEVFNNKDLKGIPKFVIDSEKIEVPNGKKIYRYSEFIKNKKIPISFIKRSHVAFVIPVDRKVGDIIKIQGAELYFKFTSKNMGVSPVEWRIDTTLEAVKQLKKTDKDFAKFMDTFSGCVKMKDADCLFKLDESFKHAAEEWALHNNKEVCQKIIDQEYKADEDYGVNPKYVVNWPLYKTFTELQSFSIDSSYTVEEFGDFYRLDIGLVGEAFCGQNSKIYLNVTRRKGKEINITVLPMTGEG